MQNALAGSGARTKADAAAANDRAIMLDFIAGISLTNNSDTGEFIEN
jgi:hypothetical protein